MRGGRGPAREAQWWWAWPWHRARWQWSGPSEDMVAAGMGVFGSAYARGAVAADVTSLEAHPRQEVQQQQTRPEQGCGTYKCRLP